MSYYATVTLAAASGNPEDVAVNTFAVGQIGTVDAALATTWSGLLKNFYDACWAAGALRGFADVGHVVKIYDIPNPKPLYPIFERTFSLTNNPGGPDMPEEVALCVSYKNTLANTVPRARRRGRIYISGWVEARNAAGRPDATAIPGLLNAYSGYVQAFNALGTLKAGVWSRTNATVYPVDTISVDNAWDTMRSRGSKATTRSTFVLP